MLRGEVRIDRRRLEAIMKLRDMSTAQLAEAVDMHYNSVRRIMKEESTSMQGLEAICNALECHPFDLLVAEGYPEPFLVAPASP